MESLPFPQYGEGEVIYEAGDGFSPMKAQHYIDNDGLSYTTLWSIGCPFHCSYCGNTKFISNDPKYKRIRHPSARYIVDEVKTARALPTHHGERSSPASRPRDGSAYRAHGLAATLPQLALHAGAGPLDLAERAVAGGRAATLEPAQAGADALLEAGGP